MYEPKILILDVELAPITAHVWRIFDETIGLNQIEKDWSILSWAAKWHGKDDIFYADMRNHCADLQNDSVILQKLWDLMDEAELIIGHNLKRFDLKKINTRFLKAGLKPTNKPGALDTLVMAKSQFAFTSNKLEYIASFLGVGEKSKHKKFHGFELWSECMRGNPEAWEEMELYNKNDVIITERVFDKLSPYCKTINRNAWRSDRDNLVCSCGSENLQSAGTRGNNQGIYYRIRCRDCGKSFKSKQAITTKAQRKRFLKED